MNLDDRLYCLQHTNLPQDLVQQVVEADKLYLQDKDGEATAIVSRVEAECKNRGIETHKPEFGIGGF